MMADAEQLLRVADIPKGCRSQMRPEVSDPGLHSYRLLTDDKSTR